MTIYALSSGPGTAGISVIRVSGTATQKIIYEITKKDPPEPRVATRRKFNKIKENELIDEGILIWFPAPNSYTGEDMAEFHVHGSKAVIEAINLSLSKIEGRALVYQKILLESEMVEKLKLLQLLKKSFKNDV